MVEYGMLYRSIVARYPVLRSLPPGLRQAALRLWLPLPCAFTDCDIAGYDATASSALPDTLNTQKTAYVNA